MFLCSYATYLAGEKRKEEERVENTPSTTSRYLGLVIRVRVRVRERSGYDSEFLMRISHSLAASYVLQISLAMQSQASQCFTNHMCAPNHVTPSYQK